MEGGVHQQQRGVRYADDQVFLERVKSRDGLISKESTEKLNGIIKGTREEQRPTVTIQCCLDFNHPKLVEIKKKAYAAIDEHKDVITVEYRNLKRELDIERGKAHSELKLAKKEKRSKKTLEGLEKSEFHTKRAHMCRLHEMLITHHFSLAGVEENTTQAQRDETMQYVSSISKTEMSLWKRMCRDLHDVLDIQIKGFTVKSKWKQMTSIAQEGKEVLEQGRHTLEKFYTSNGILPSPPGDNKEDGWRAIGLVEEVVQELEEAATLKKSTLVKEWYGLSEAWREKLCKQTQLLKFSHRNRVDEVANKFNEDLKFCQEQSARRHEKLMQKIAREEELLDKERTEMRAKHGDRKSRGRHTHHHDDDKHQHNHGGGQGPPLQMNPQMMGGMPGMMGGMGGIPGMPQMYGGGGGGYPGMGGNYNMSNGVDNQSSSANSDDDDYKSHSRSPVEHDSSRRMRLVYKDSMMFPMFAVTVQPAVDRQCMENIIATFEKDSTAIETLSEIKDNACAQSGHPLTEALVSQLTQADKIKLVEDYLCSRHEIKENITPEDSSTTQLADAEHEPMVKDEDITVALLVTDLGCANINVNADSDSDSDDDDDDSDDDDDDEDDDEDDDSGGSAASKPVAKSKADSSKSSKLPEAHSPKKNYKEFVPNYYKDKWTFTGMFDKCPDMDKFIDKFCPCLKDKYETFKEEREEKRHKRELKNNILLRLREEVARMDKM